MAFNRGTQRTRLRRRIGGNLPPSRAQNDRSTKGAPPRGPKTGGKAPRPRS